MRAVARFGKGVQILNMNIDMLYRKFPEYCQQAVYNGSGVVADQFRSNLQAVPISHYDHDPFKYNRDPNKWGEGGFWFKGQDVKPMNGITASQKEGLLSSMGISPFKTGIETINKKIGVDGYNSTVTKKYAKGQPNAMILRSLEKGTTYRKAYQVVRNTANQTRYKCKKEMERTLTAAVLLALNR